MATQTDLIHAAIRNATGARVVQPDNATLAEFYVGAFLSDLVARRVTPEFAPNAIPGQYFNELVRAFAEVIAPFVGGLREKNLEIVADAEARLASIYRYATDDQTVLQILEQLEVYTGGALRWDADAVARRLPGVIAELARRDVYYFSDAANIPGEAVNAFVRYVAASMSEPQRLDVMMDSERRLRALKPAPERMPPVRACYF